MNRHLYHPTDARRLLNPGAVVIATTSWRGEANAAPIAWAAPLSMEPPYVGCVIHPGRHTADMIRFSEEFALNIPGPQLLKQTAYLGSYSGKDENKIEAGQLKTFKSINIEAPLLEDCLAWIECGLRDVIPIGDHSLFVGEVLQVQAVEDAYAENWLLKDDNLKPLTFLGGSMYAQIDKLQFVDFETDEHGKLIGETSEEREEREETEAITEEERSREGDIGYTEMEQSRESTSADSSE